LLVYPIVGNRTLVRRATAAAGLVTILLQPHGIARLAAFHTAESDLTLSVNAVTDSEHTAASPGLTRMAIETPLSGATVPPLFLIAGYAFDPEATSGSGVDAVALYAYPNFGSGQTPTFLGIANYGITRDDVARVYGSQGTTSGFQLTASGLTAGTYRIFAFGHNVATGGYTAYVFSDVTVSGMSALTIDTPAASATVMPSFQITGWAIDNRAMDGTGIDAVHLYLSGDGIPVTFLGVANYGVTRSDIAAAYGARFATAGYDFTVSGLRPGAYLLSAFAHSTVTDTFTLAQARPFTVDATTLMSIDYPSAGGSVDGPTFSVMGWALDRSTSSGTGVDTLHVYAFRDPGSGQAPIFLGVASTGVSRPDVAAIFGSRFDPSGYWLTVDRAAAGLTPGVYDIVVWTHSSVCNAFTAVSVVRVRMQ
jgi:hypothetical protein